MIQNIIKSSIKGMDMPGGEAERQQIEESLVSQGQQLMIPNLIQ